MTDIKEPTGRITLSNVRLAFPSLFVATKVDDDSKARFNATFLLPPDHPQVKEIRAKQIAVAREKWKGKADDILAELNAKDRMALHNGDFKKQYDGFAGNLFVAAASAENSKPTLVDGDAIRIEKDNGVLYPGCYVNAKIEIWAMDNKFGKRVNATLRGVQFLRDGDSFGGARPADASEFAPVGEGADAEEFA